VRHTLPGQGARPVGAGQLKLLISGNFLLSISDSTPGPRPTLGELQREHPWTWLWCERCQHRAPFAFAAAVIRWGSTTSSDVLRQRARCTACGSKGATLQHPPWGGNSFGFMPFPTDG
jgi:hypothetical protein